MTRWLLAFMLLVSPATAADVVVSAKLDPTRLQVGESGTLEVEVLGAQNVAAPEVPAVDGVTMRYVGPSTQVSIVNGSMTQSITHRFTVLPTRAGTFTIGPVAVAVGTTRYQAAAVTLTVVAAGAGHAGQGAQPGGDQLRLVLSSPKTQLYVHERVPLRLELWVGNVRVSGLQYPTIPGDGVAIEKLPQQPAQRREQTSQGAFQVVDFATTLTALRSGTLTVGPATMGLNLVVRARRQDPFFGFFGDTEKPTELHSEPLVLTVLPLPDEGRPADFAGAVGRFTMNVKAAPLSLGAGDPVTVTTTIRGEGDFTGVVPPAIAASDALRVYPVQPAGQPAGAERTFEQVVIPQRAGTVSLPEMRLSYFDPEARAYRTVSQAPVALAVRAAAGAETSPRIVGTPQPRTAPAEKLGRDLVSIKDDPGALAPAGARRWRSGLFWGVQAVPLVVWIAAVIWDRRRRRLSGDVRYARFSRAGRTARQAIAGARQKLGAGDRGAFYDALARAVSEYLAAKLDLPPGAVSPETVGERLGSHGVAPAVARELEEFFAACERARFAPTADASGDMQRTLDRADAIVRALERERRLGKAVAAACLLVALAAQAWAAPAADSPNTIFFRGNTLYAEERYPEAAAQYEQLLAAGLASGNLYFNLGNAYFKAGDVGRAILDYERARRLIPGDPDLLANLGFARSLAGAADEPAVWTRIAFPLAERFSTDRLLLVASILWTALFLLLAAGRLAASLERTAQIAAGVAAVALLLVLPSAAYRLATVDLAARAVVVAKDEVTVRFEPSTGGTAHFQAKTGTLVRVIAERAGWVQVARDDGRRGWVERDAVAPL